MNQIQAEVKAAQGDDMVVLYECGICNHVHPWDWDGDCREDANRFAGYSDYTERTGIPENRIEVRSWEDRQEADAE